MIYSTPEFLVLLALTLPAFILIRSYAIRFVILLAASLFFYSWAGLFDTIIFLFVVALSWAAPALALQFPRARKPLVAFGIIVLAAHLLFWKYMPWIVRVAQQLNPAVHGGEPLLLPLPVGISFFTLQGIAYLVDFYEGEAEFIPLGEYLLFKSFFPQLVAGPIVRVPQLLPQLRNLLTPSIDDLTQGARLFCWGFFKKIALADRIGPWVDEVFMRAPSYDRVSLVSALLGYTVQIWADFSGYSDMGIGVARMFGIKLPTNFLSPYLALKPSEFWRRWHITLSQWIRDYIYIPLGGSRGSPLRVVSVAVLTMAISGLWHGANWTFVAWGFYHGFLLVAERVLTGDSSAAPAIVSRTRPPFFHGAAARVSMLARWAVMMTAIVFGWLLFRAQSFTAVGVFLRGIATGAGAESAMSQMRAPLAFALFACMASQLWGYVDLKTGRQVIPEWIRARLPFLENPLTLRLTGALVGVAMSALVLGSLFLRSDSPAQPFIYFQF